MMSFLKIAPLARCGGSRSALLATAVVCAAAISYTASARAQTSDSENSGAESVPPAEKMPGVRRIFVPATALSDLLKPDKQNVLLSQEEFQRLWDASQTAQADVPSPADEPGVTTANYSAQLEDGQVLLRAEFELTQFAGDWRVVRIPVGGLSVASALLDGEPAAVSRDPENPDVLLLFNRLPGLRRLTLELTRPVVPVGSDALVELDFSGAPSGTLTLSLPEKKSVRLDGLALVGTDGASSSTEFRVPVGGKTRATLLMTAGDAAQTADSLVFARTQYQLQLAPGEVDWKTATSVTVFGKTLDQLKLTVPNDLEIVRVDSPGLAAWEINDASEGNRSELTLTYRQPFSGTRNVDLAGVFVPAEEQWAVPTLLIEGTDAHVASVLVTHDPTLRLHPEYDTSVRPAAVGVTKTSDPAAAPRMAFQTLQADFDLSFLTVQKTGVLQVAMTSLLRLSDDGLDLSATMDVQAEVAPLFEVLLQLPADFQVTSARIADQNVDWTLASGEAGSNNIHLELPAPLNPGETARIEFFAHADPEDWPVENNSVIVSLPQLRLPQADLVEARFGITTSDDLTVSPVDVTGLETARGQDAAALKRAATALGQELQLGFTDQDTDYAGELSVDRKPAVMSVSTFTLSQLETERTVTDVRAIVTVEAGGLEGLLIQLPESVSPEARFFLVDAEPGAVRPPIAEAHGATIIEQTVSEVVDGQRTWALRFDRRLRGVHELRARLLEPRAPEIPVMIRTPVFVGADRQDGWIAVEARDDQRLTVTGASVIGEPLRVVDPIDLPGMASNEATTRRIVAGYRFTRPGATAAIVEQPLTSIPFPTAVADKSDVRTVISDFGESQHRWRVDFRAVGVQNLRLSLPQKAELWSAAIDGQPIDVRQSPDGYQIPLPPAASADAVRSLEVIYSTERDATQSEGQIELREPLLAVQLGSGGIQPLDVLARDWTLIYPEDMVLLESDGALSPTSPLRDDSFLARIENSLRAPSWSTLGIRLAVVAILLVVLGLVMLVWRAAIPAWLGTVVGVTLVAVLFAGLLSVLFLGPMRRNAAPFAETAVSSVKESFTFARPSDSAAPPERSEPAGMGGSGAETPVLPPQAEPAAQSSPELTQAFPQQAAPDAGTDDATALSVNERDEQIGKGALLSLSLDLEVPDGMRQTSFRSIGTRAEDRAGLDVRVASRSRREVLALIVACAVALLMWWLRDARRSLRAVFAVAVLVVPLALIAVIPAEFSMLVEGILLGGMGGVVLWGVRSACDWIRRLVPVSSKALAVSARTASAIVVCVCCLLWTFPAWGEETPGGKAVSEAPPTPTFADGLPSIIVPYGEGGFEDSTHVLLPQGLFDKLRARAGEATPAIASIPGTVSDVVHHVEIPIADAADPHAPRAITVRSEMAIHSFREEPVTLRLPLSAVAVREARMGDAPAIVRTGEDGKLELIVPRPGRHQLTLVSEAHAQLNADSGDFALTLDSVAAGRLRVTLPPRDDWAITMNRDDAPLGYRRLRENGTLMVESAVDRGGRISVAWQPQQSTSQRQEIVQVESLTAVEFNDRGVDLRAAYDVIVRQGSPAQVSFEFPETVRLKNLSGTDVGGWEEAVTEGQRTLTVFLRRAVNDRTRIVIDAYSPLDTSADAEAEFEIPSLAPLNVARESGQVILLADAARDVRGASPEGIARTAALSGDLGKELNPSNLPVRETYRFTARPWTLNVVTSLRAEQARVVADYGVFLGHRKITIGSRLKFDLSGAPRRLLRILLPHDFVLIDARSAEASEWFEEDGALIVDLGEPRVGVVTVDFEGTVPRRPAEEELVLETPLPQEMQGQETRLAMWIEEGLEASVEDYAGWRPVAPEELPSEMRSLRPQAARFAFRSSALEPELISFRASRAQPRLICDAVTLIALSDASVEYGLNLRWTIERAAVDELTFSTPGWLAGRLEFTGTGIQKTSSVELDDGRVRWTIVLDRAMLGQYLVTAVATAPAPADGQILAPAISFEQSGAASEEFQRVTSQQSFALLVNLSAAQVAPTGSDTHDIVPVENLPFVLRDELVVQALEVVRVPDEEPVTWQMVTVQEQIAAAATVTSADLTTVLAADGSWRTQAEYRVRNRGQQFLAVRLPAGSRMLSALVKDRPVRALETTLAEDTVALVPLPQTSAADLSFPVRVFLQGALPQALSPAVALRAERIQIPAPRIVTQRESAEFGVPVVFTNWTVLFPEEFDASPVFERNATNLSHHAGDAIDVMSELQEFQELMDLNRLVKDRRLSVSQRSLAASNLKVLGSKLQQSGSDSPYDSYNSNGLIPEELRDLASKRGQLLYESQQNTAAFEAEQIELGVPVGGVQSYSDFSGAAARRYITSNSMAIQRDNQAVVRDGTEPDALFGMRFDANALGGRASSSKAAPHASDEMSQRSRAVLKERLSRQEPLNAPLDSTPAVDQRFLANPMSGLGRPDIQQGGTSPEGRAADATQSAPANGELLGGEAPPGAVAGLSLPLQIPEDGRRLTFSKLGGDPVLTLAVRPRETVRTGLRWLWAVLWMGVGMLVLWSLRDDQRGWTGVLGAASLGLGLFILLFLPAPAAWCGLPLILLGIAPWFMHRTNDASMVKQAT